MLETFICDHIEGYKRRRDILSDYLLIAPFDSFPLETWLKIWFDAAKYEVQHRSGVEKAYFAGWHHRESFMIPHEEHAKLYTKLPG